ncbi:MAG: hypothetical protein ACI8XB_001614 [Patiriisocius sp.]|jgi:hypothetical protein
MLSAIVAIVGGLMASYSLIIAKRPETKEYLDKIRPYQEWLGVLLTIFGVRGILTILFQGLGSINGGIISLALFGAELVAGFLLAYPIISRLFLEKNETARNRAESMRATLLQYQVPAGVILIIMGILKLL